QPADFRNFSEKLQIGKIPIARAQVGYEERIVELVNDRQATARDHPLEKRWAQQRRFSIDEDRVEAHEIAQKPYPLNVSAHHFANFGGVIAGAVEHLVEPRSFKGRVMNIDSHRSQHSFPKLDAATLPGRVAQLIR